MIPRKLIVIAFAVVAVLCEWPLVASVRAAESAVAVGQVTFSVGTVRLLGAAGAVGEIGRGSVIHVGDRIETAEGGHVHVRFVDGATVSVRPSSRLHVEVYRYAADAPQDSAIRLNVETGVVRSVTGRGGEAARDRFRLNTPIAAIGVRGTDFIVATDLDRVRVAVQSGAVVFAPIDDRCRADAFGPCGGGGARLLSAEMGDVMLELRRHQPTPQLVPSRDAALTQSPPPAAAAPVSVASSSEDASGSQGRRHETVERVAAQVLARTAENVPVVVPPPPAVVPEPEPVVPVKPVPPPVVITPPVPEVPVTPVPVVPEQPVVVVPPPPPQLVWGRWGAAFPGESMSQPVAAARDGKAATVGNGQYLLYRSETPGVVAIPTNLGRVDFALQESQVHLVQTSGASPGRVVGGSLAINFSNATYATNLAVTHDLTGAQSIQASGSVRDDGIFAYNNGKDRVAGAVSFDGKEAGYFFERGLPAGTLMGITRWTR